MRTGTCDRCGASFVDTSPAQKRRFCSDKCRKRYCDETTGRPVCIDCGGPCAARTAWKHGARPLEHRCVECNSKYRHEGQAIRRERIAELWQAGLDAPSIAAELGSTSISIHSEISVMRREGWDLDVRRPDCQGDHMGPAIAARWRRAA